LLARSAYDVLVQYGANQPDYDLVAVKQMQSKRLLCISVKGSQDGGWMLAVRFVKPGVDYHTAIDKWLAVQPEELIYMFVQFVNVPLNQAPRVYIARPPEIATHLKSQCNGRGHGSLQENFRRDRPGSKYDHKIPDDWLFSCERIDSI